MLERGTEQIVITRQNTYKVSLDRGRFNMLLHHLGRTGDFSEVEVDLKPQRHWHGIPHVEVELDGQCAGDRIEVFLGGQVRDYERNLNLATRIAQREFVLPWENFSGLHTRRLKQYLRQAPPERSRQFAGKLLLHVLQRRLNRVLIHEAQHTVDSQTPQTLGQQFKEDLGPYLLEGCLAPLVFTSASIGSWIYSWHSFLVEGSSTGVILGPLGLIGSLAAMYVTSKRFKNYVYHGRAIERRADETAWRNIRNPFWRQIVKIEPHPVDNA